MAGATFRERFRYRVDNFLAGGSGPLFFSLLVSLVFAIAFVLTLRLILGYAIEDDDTEARKHAWVTFLQITDSGAMAEDSDSDPVYKIAAVVAGFLGLVIFSSLVAFLTTALDGAIAQLRKGHSRVIESGHTLVLGATGPLGLGVQLADGTGGRHAPSCTCVPTCFSSSRMW